MDSSGRPALVERPELCPAFQVSTPKEKIRISKSFAISLGPACQTYWDVEQSAF
jgi:hypothetical protein